MKPDSTPAELSLVPGTSARARVWIQSSLVATALAAGTYACGGGSTPNPTGTGGAPSTGGAPATGGATGGTATGGAPATGGAVGTGGAKTGGTTGSTGGSAGLTYEQCGRDDVLFLSRNPSYFFQNDVWNKMATNGEQCVSVTELSYKVKTYTYNLSNSNTPASYPSYVRGCHYGNCSADNFLPKQYSAITTATTSADVTPTSGAKYDVSYDLWLDPANKMTGQNQTEIMIWLDWNGVQPIGSSQGNATIDGKSYDVWYGNAGWNVASFRMMDRPHKLTNFDMKPIIDYAASKGWVKKEWYLTSVQFGFEGWSGIAGALVNSFSVDLK